MITKIKNAVQDIPIKSLRNTPKNTTNNYINVITKRQLAYKQIGYATRKSAISNLPRIEGVRDKKNPKYIKNRLFGSCRTLL